MATIDTTATAITSTSIHKKIQEEIQEEIDRKFSIAWKVVKKHKWIKGYNCRRKSRRFGSYIR